MKITQSENTLIITDFSSFDLGLSADCGQAFRWKQDDDGYWHGIVQGKYLKAKQTDSELIMHTSREDFDSLWKNYFDLDTDYNEICNRFSSEPNLQKAVSCCPGIHILKQEPWEALCSFIISQNNNIPRIKGIIERLCENFGENTNGGFTFPDANKLASLEPEELAPLRAGFRAKYIIDAARKVSNGEVDFEKIACSPIEFGREELQKICGVGAKVAECTLLYGFYKTDAFPIDVWVKRIMAEMYPDGFPECADGVKGIAQQYLFHWRRTQF
ncbi:MAG: DNA-3-methyladenine glycosylase 2 family protein [Clostridia bacterium]|nr:DNA-3-methyladenine glycosylase 2 family protein [Clostridia bacterium]